MATLRPVGVLKFLAEFLGLLQNLPEAANRPLSILLSFHHLLCQHHIVSGDPAYDPLCESAILLGVGGIPLLRYSHMRLLT